MLSQRNGGLCNKKQKKGTGTFQSKGPVPFYSNKSYKSLTPIVLK